MRCAMTIESRAGVFPTKSRADRRRERRRSSRKNVVVFVEHVAEWCVQNRRGAKRARLAESRSRAARDRKATSGARSRRGEVASRSAAPHDLARGRLRIASRVHGATVGLGTAYRVGKAAGGTG